MNWLNSRWKIAELNANVSNGSNKLEETHIMDERGRLSL